MCNAARLFTKLAREISVAVRSGGSGDPDANYRLRLAIQKAKSNNMPNDNIDRSIKKALGEGDGANYDEVIYEGFGPGGAAILVQALTDNRNRTVSEVRSVFAKYGGNMGESGSVGWMFANRGVITINTDGKDPDDVALMAIDAGAADVEDSDGVLEAYTEPQDLKGGRRGDPRRGARKSMRRISATSPRRRSSWTTTRPRRRCA